MALTVSQLRQKMTTEALNNQGQPWTEAEAAVELITAALAAAAAGPTPAPPAKINVFHKWANNQANIVIPIGVVAWSVQATGGGTTYVTTDAGAVPLQGGTSIRGGGAPPATLNHIITVNTQTGPGTCAVVWEVLVP